MFCSKCGKKIGNDDKFCTSCGSSAVDGQAAAVPSFDQFMELKSRQFEAAKKEKEKERSGHFKTKADLNKKSKEPVKINVGLVDLVDNSRELKIRRGSTLPVSVKKSDSALTVKQLAVEKQLAHNQTLRRNPDVEWILLYPDMDVVLHVPGTTELFCVEEYKESLGKPYNRINLYLCKQKHYDAILNSDEQEQEGEEKDGSSEGITSEFLSSSGEISFNIPENAVMSDNHDKAVHRRVRQTTNQVSHSSRSSRHDTCDGLGPRLTPQSTSEVLNETPAATHPSASNSIYTQYCNVIDLSTETGFEESMYADDNSELLEEVLMQSVFHENQERESIQSLLRLYQAEKEGDDYQQIIRVRRKHIWEDCVRAVSKNSFRKYVQLKVHFIGEDAEDEGGPLREFFRLVLKAIVDHSGILEGADDRKVFTSNPLLIQQRAYYCAGVILSTSLQQGGPPMCCLSGSVYDYFHGGTSGCIPTILDVTDVDARSKIGKVTHIVNQIKAEDFCVTLLSKTTELAVEFSFHKGRLFSSSKLPLCSLITTDLLSVCFIAVSTKCGNHRSSLYFYNDVT